MVCCNSALKEIIAHFWCFIKHAGHLIFSIIIVMSKCTAPWRWFLLNPSLRTNVVKCQNVNLSSRRTYYDVLEVSQSCSSKEIKNAYVKLCMECHPDKKPGDLKQHKKFLELNDAYTTLIDANSRRTYDKNFAYQTNVDNRNDFRTHQEGFSQYNYSYHERNYWRDESIWRNRSQFKYNSNESYYGIKSSKRVNNGWIILWCFILIIFGSACHVAVYRYSLSYKEKYVNEKNRTIIKAYEDAKRKSQEMGREKWIEDLKERCNFADNNEAMKE